MSKPTIDPIQTGNVSDKPLNEWVQNWFRWFLSIGEEENPAYSSSDYTRKNDYDQGRVLYGWPDEAKNKVWFLAGAHGGSSRTRSIIPQGNDWHILVPAYIMSGSIPEFPKLNKEQIKTLVEDDVNAVGKNAADAKKKGRLKATLDGQDLTDRLQRIETDWFTVNGIPDDNIYDLEVDSIEMMTIGYWFFLAPLKPGDHLVSVHGEAPNYMTDMTFNLTVRGGDMSPRFF